VLTNWCHCRGTQTLVATISGEFLFNWYIFLTHLATPQDTGTTPQGNLHKKIIGFDSLARSSSEPERTLTSFPEQDYTFTKNSSPSW
jgi:hypothetical protein